MNNRINEIIIVKKFEKVSCSNLITSFINLKPIKAKTIEPTTTRLILSKEFLLFEISLNSGIKKIIEIAETK
jgi:hypothetical protein